MPLFQCECCGCIENTATANQGFKGRLFEQPYDWSYAPERKGKKLCSACGPGFYRDGKPTRFGVWHNQFKRQYLPLGEYEICPLGNIRHATTKLIPTEADYIVKEDP